MSSIVDVQVCNEKVIFNVPQKGIVEEIRNVASFDSKSGGLISTGISQAEFQANYPKKWDKYQDRLEFRPVFGTAPFEPEAVAMFLLGWWDAMIGKVAGNMIVLRSQAKLEMNISFDGYEGVPLQKQQEFEYLVYRYLYAKKLTINGDTKYWDKRNRLILWSIGALNYLFIIAFVMLGVIPVFLLMNLLSMAEMPVLLDFLFHIIALFGPLFVFMVAGDFVSKLLWTLCMKPFFSNETLIRALEYQSGLPQKPIRNKSASLITRWLLAKSG